MKEVVVVLLNADEETPVSIKGPVTRVDWYCAGEGYHGDYNPNDPEDQELLRFDVYRKDGKEWEPVEDASYCTTVAVDTPQDILVEKLKVLYERFNDALINSPDASVKKLGEALSWI